MSKTEPTTLLFHGDLRATLAGDHRVSPLGHETRTQAKLVDTFDTELAHAGMLLVAAEETLTLLDAGGAETRQDSARAGFIDEMPEGPVTDILAKRLSPLRRLLDLVAAESRAQDVALRDAKDRLLCHGHLRLLTTKDGHQVSLLGLRPLSGRKGDFKRLVKHLRSDPSLCPPRQALEALAPGVTAYQPKPDVPLLPDMPAFDAASAIIAAHLPVARANEPGIIADHDSEFLHDYRVALRKIRSVLSLFKGVYSPEQVADLKARLSALMSVTGLLRDLDVYLIERPRYVQMVPDSLRPGVGLLFDHFARERHGAHDALCRHLQSETYAAEIAALQDLFAKPQERLRRGEEADHPARDYARQLIRKRYRKVRKIARAIDADTADAEIHQLRIQCKKLRYLMEFFAPLFGKAEMKRLIKALKKLQDNLGDFNDSVVQQEALSSVTGRLTDTDHDGQLEIARSIGALTTVLHQRQDAERARIMQTFAAFDAPKTRAGFKALLEPQIGSD
ncbi:MULTISPECIES: CHAD domain-containing protein [Mameliella]|uniref:CHAD domain-containing protein n=1 Tax=Mameliella TaxID=1434019 RepID=UPI000B52C9BF|nr:MULTISPECIES: CHAD domain-containing protein [Mameliella]MCR9272597.1 CHAD domain-containing protein [Paracoccaceae bacterium]OWV60343.1 metal-binding protein [Mameliella alba]